MLSLNQVFNDDFLEHVATYVLSYSTKGVSSTQEE